MKHARSSQPVARGALATGVLVIALIGDPGYADAAAPDISEGCAALAGVDLSSLEDAPTQVSSTKVVPADGNNPAYCEAKGYVAPNVGFELRLPTTNWNGKVLEIGCGGFCGVGWIFWCEGPLRRGYACIASDMGHQGGDGKWAQNNLQAVVDWAHRGPHVSVLAAKAISEKYYGRKPQKAYYMGCSNGGRQGMVEAQRFPWDFDGIIAGAPVVNLSETLANRVWLMKSLTGSGGKVLLSRDDVKLLHDSVLKKCDADDGIKDRVIGDPLSCSYDPAVLACKTDGQQSCLSPTQVQAVKRVYAGPTTSTGEAYGRGRVAGSELTWIDEGWWSTDGLVDGNTDFTIQFFRYAGFMPAPGVGWTWRDYDFDRDNRRQGMIEALSGATNPDLRKFKAAGGKLLMFEGWTDESHFGTVDYYETVERTMGGRSETQSFVRLFMVPGMDHCTGGDGAFAIDYLGYLEAWVEQGKAPDMLLGAHVKNYENWTKALTQLTFPIDSGLSVTFTRPHYPYPFFAKYTGRGDPNDASSFVPENPAKRRPNQ